MQSKNISFFDDVWDQRDKRMDDYFILNNPFVLLISCLLYVSFSLFVGPWFMKNKNPYNIKPLIISFNIVMIIINAYIHIQGWRYGWNKYKLICEPVDTSNAPEALYIAKLSYYYLMTKFIDWIDTLFFIMRKKFNHVSTLHVYHHTCMPLNAWSVVRFLPGGHMTFTGLINTFIHVIMHSYYALSALGPKWQKYLWWKKHITRLQIFQFVFGIIYLLPLLMPSCGIPKTFLVYMLPQGFLFLSLFTNFYRKTYNNNNINNNNNNNNKIMSKNEFEKTN